MFITGVPNKPALVAFSTDGGSPDATLINTNVALYAHGTDYAGYFAHGKTYFADNVGIGTTNPLAPLQVHRDSSSSVLLSASDENDPPNHWAVVALQGPTAVTAPKIPNSSGGVYVESDGAYGVYQANELSKNYFHGNVGINTTDPISSLTIKDDNISGTFPLPPAALITTTTSNRIGLAIVADSTNDVHSVPNLGDVALYAHAAIPANPGYAALFIGSVVTKGPFSVSNTMDVNQDIVSSGHVKVGPTASDQCNNGKLGIIRLKSIGTPPTKIFLQGCVRISGSEQWKEL
jgi:hypothetical protein